jgi:hypothetical protein
MFISYPKVSFFFDLFPRSNFEENTGVRHGDTDAWRCQDKPPIPESHNWNFPSPRTTIDHCLPSRISGTVHSFQEPANTFPEKSWEAFPVSCRLAIGNFVGMESRPLPIANSQSCAWFYWKCVPRFTRSECFHRNRNDSIRRLIGIEEKPSGRG